MLPIILNNSLSFAIILIRKGKAYVCDMSAEEISETRGTPSRPGKESSYRTRSVEEKSNTFYPDAGRRISRRIKSTEGKD